MTQRWVRALYFNLLRFVKSIWYNTNTHTIDIFETTTKIFIFTMVVTVRASSISLPIPFSISFHFWLHIFIPLECGNSDISSLWLPIRFIFISHSKWINDGISEFYCVIHQTISCSLHEICYLAPATEIQSMYVFVCCVHKYIKVCFPACLPAWKVGKWKQQHTHLSGKMIDRATKIPWN